METSSKPEGYVNELSDHYSRLAVSYDELWLYSDEYIRALTVKIASALDLRPTDRLVDVGCGTGIYASALRDARSLVKPVLCADASAEMLGQLPRDCGLEPRVADAIQLFESGVEGDKFLMKEVVHHVDDKLRLFRAIAQTLSPDDIMLILLLPPTIDYPLFDAALRRYEQLQPHYDDLVALAEAAGLRPGVSLQSVPLSIEKARYSRMVQGRYMSILSTFSDEELEAGVAEMDARNTEDPLNFDDTFVFLTLTI